MNHDFLRYANRLREDGLVIPGARNDANEAALFAQSLTYLCTQPLRTLFPGIVWRNLIPVKTGIPAGAEAIAIRQLSVSVPQSGSPTSLRTTCLKSVSLPARLRP